MKIPKLPIDAKSKSVLTKSAGLLVVVIIVFALLSKYMTSGGKTLAQYASENPEQAYGTNVSLSEATRAVNTISDNGVSDNVESENEIYVSENITSEKLSLSTNGDSIPSDRIEYEPDFYYEPLSSELRTYITGISYPASGSTEIAYDDLCYVHVLHYDFSGEVCEGELISNKYIAQDLVEIFYGLYQAEYQIEKINLIDDYNGEDTASMEDNNTSCFNYRNVDDTNKLSKHALGLAVDINPLYNPYIRYTEEGDQIISPIGSEDYTDRSQSFPYKIDSYDLCYQLFIQHGFTWGGNWNSCKDYQHFQKKLTDSY
ncbi:MAG TPA: M15 family metallopeptidase [Lachnospiraceae bacterium]|nr:M15 family metallopeptidase [Lachnospiraceae bacterium]